MQAIAKARYVRTSPRKARLVIDAIRGMDAKEALDYGQAHVLSKEPQSASGGMSAFGNNVAVNVTFPSEASSR